MFIGCKYDRYCLLICQEIQSLIQTDSFTRKTSDIVVDMPPTVSREYRGSCDIVYVMFGVVHVYLTGQFVVFCRQITNSCHKTRQGTKYLQYLQCTRTAILRCHAFFTYDGHIDRSMF